MCVRGSAAERDAGVGARAASLVKATSMRFLCEHAQAANHLKHTSKKPNVPGGELAERFEVRG
jgi:hypothetical protein